LDFGIGKGYRHNEFAGFCIPMAEADERFEEGLAVILKSWTSEQRFSHHGKYWHFDDVVVEPPTHQKPHPPIWMGAGSAASIAKVAERGFKLLLDQYAPIAAVIERFNLYKTEVEKRGRVFDPNDVALSRGFYVAKDEADKMRAIATRLANQRRTAGLAQTPDKSNKATLLSYADASADAALYGSPDEIARKLERLRNAGFEQILLSGPAGSRENLRAFARQMMPAFAGPQGEKAPGRAPQLVNP
jgi:alkanesulfonate monooxygenase SsuD/methylene tetrahydromethanopterin reductase-like flavin-dependent oxidoreductase (luciferase family)